MPLTICKTEIRKPHTNQNKFPFYFRSIGMCFCSFLLLSLSFSAKAVTVNFNLDNIFYDTGNQLNGEFAWTYSEGDFENGTGVFTSLDNFGIFTLSDLNTTIEPNTIEITLAGSFHDQGIDISLFLVNPFSPNSSVLLDLGRSKYSFGGNGFNDGNFLFGKISPTLTSVPLPSAFPLFSFALGLVSLAIMKQNKPCRPE